LEEEAHLKVMRLLKANPRISQRQLAKELDVSLGKINYCVKALVEKGWVKARNFRTNKNKLAYAYILTPKGLEQKARLTGKFLNRKQKEFELLRNEIQLLSEEIEDNA